MFSQMNWDRMFNLASAVVIAMYYQAEPADEGHLGEVVDSLRVDRAAPDGMPVAPAANSCGCGPGAAESGEAPCVFSCTSSTFSLVVLSAPVWSALSN